MIRMDSYLRNVISVLHCEQGVSYKRIAEEIGIKQDSIGKWMRGKFGLSEKHQRLLYNKIMNGDFVR